MGSNRHLISDKEAGITKKLELMAERLRGSLTAQGYQTREGFLFDAIKILRTFYMGMDTPSLEEPLIRPDDLPDSEEYNELWNNTNTDLISIFTEMENLGLLTVANFNYMATESNRLTARLKAVSSKLGDYILYTSNPNRDSFYFKDSFNDLSKVEVDSDLLNAEECETNQDEGIVLLPVNKEKNPNITITKTPIINPNSNGSVGNNQELGAVYNGDITSILDNNADTWFEYERVILGTADDKEPLILDMVINLGEEKILNHIRINPNNFGTKTAIKINTIETSLDGQAYTNVKDDIPIAGFTVEDEENVFQLAPSTSKFAGQGIYTFTPRKVKYVHLVFQQDEPYVINTPTGEMLRYAVGLRDIQIMAFQYKSVGELISTPFATLDEIRKVLIETNQNPAQLSELASIDYSVSPDDGGTWYQIQPKDIVPLSGIISTPEILDFNGADPDTIETAAPVGTLRLKMLLKRNDEAFAEGAATFRKTVEKASELHTVPTSTFQLELDHPPVGDVLSVVDPLFGSRGIPRSPYVLGYGSGDTRRFRLPLTEIPRPVEKTGVSGSWNTVEKAAPDWMHIEVAGEEWTHGVSGIEEYSDSDKVFTLDHSEGVVDFTEALTTGQLVSLWFDSERITPTAADDNHVAILDFHTSNNKDDFTIKRYEEVDEDAEVLPYKATRVNLAHQNITDIVGIIEQLAASYPTQKTYLNGRDELTASTEWSIDVTKGILYLGAPTSADTSISISYRYQPITELSQEEWDWVDDDTLKKKVKIKEAAWKTRQLEDESINLETDHYAFDLSSLGILNESVKFAVTSGNLDALADSQNPFVKEVPYKNGETEFGSRVVKKSERVASVTPVAGIATWDFAHNITAKENFLVKFTDRDTFQTTVTGVHGGSPLGSFFVDRLARKVDIRTDLAILKPGKVIYYYETEDSNYPDNGLYSIDYERGIVFTQRPLDSTWILSVNYKYTDYRAEYKIARLLAPSSYKLDVTTRTIRITDKEILDRLTLPQGGLDSSQSYYLVNYEYVAETREDVEELKDFFSPVVKDYALRVLTKGNVF